MTTLKAQFERSLLYVLIIGNHKPVIFIIVVVINHGTVIVCVLHTAPTVLAERNSLELSWVGHGSGN